MTSLVLFQPARTSVRELDPDADASLVKDLNLRYWQLLLEAGTACFALQAEQVYSFREEQVLQDGELVKKYQLWVDDWPEFCLRFLVMDPGEASDLKRIWEVYVEQCGFGLDDLVRAGKSRLRTALRRVDDLWPDCQPLLRLVFGDPGECRACGQFVAFAEGEPPDLCPFCGADYQGVAPGTFAEVLAYCQRSREDDSRPGPVSASFEFESLDPDSFQVLGKIQIGEISYVLPPWLITRDLREEIVEGIFQGVLVGTDTFSALRSALERRLR